jgi:hypothetical protein
MTDKEMFEKSFQRPTNYFKLTKRQQWEIDKELGILDWKGLGLTTEERTQFYNYYEGISLLYRL